jgi:uncharacterized protein YcgL (UPF0745 family)
MLITEQKKTSQRMKCFCALRNSRLANEDTNNKSALYFYVCQNDNTMILPEEARRCFSKCSCPSLAVEALMQDI